SASRVDHSPPHDPHNQPQRNQQTRSDRDRKRHPARVPIVPPSLPHRAAACPLPMAHAYPINGQPTVSLFAVSDSTSRCRGTPPVLPPDTFVAWCLATAAISRANACPVTLPPSPGRARLPTSARHSRSPSAVPFPYTPSTPAGPSAAPCPANRMSSCKASTASPRSPFFSPINSSSQLLDVPPHVAGLLNTPSRTIR